MPLQVLVLDIVPPEKIPGRVVPRVGVRDSGDDGNTIGTDSASSSRRGPGGATNSVQALGGGGGPKVSKGGKGDGSGDKGAAGGEQEGGAETAARGRKGSRRSGAAARKKKSSRSERFFEVSATSQVNVHTALDIVQRMLSRQRR